jgi:hypothetical protein
VVPAAPASLTSTHAPAPAPALDDSVPSDDAPSFAPVSAPSFPLVNQGPVATGLVPPATVLATPAPAGPATLPVSPADGPSLTAPDPIVQAGADAGLLPFAARDEGSQLLEPMRSGSALAALAAGAAVAAVGAVRTSAATAAAIRAAKPRPSGSRGGGSGNDGPKPPTTPPGNAGLSGAASAFGGAASGGWAAILIGFICFPTLVLRRYRSRMVCAGPAGALVLLQRPG